MSPNIEERPAAIHWLALLVAIAASQAGQVLLKFGASGLPPVDGILASLAGQVLRWQTLLGLGCYGSGTLFYAIALRRIPMSVALPCTAVSYVSATLFGLLLFHEPLNSLKFIGLLMVCAGVVLLTDLGGRRTARPLPPAAVGLDQAGLDQVGLNQARLDQARLDQLGR